jgi:hypothetical protein
MTQGEIYPKAPITQAVIDSGRIYRVQIMG